MTRCNAHTDFFDDLCSDCKKEYNEMKGIPDKTDAVIRESARFPAKYKEFTEERAKQLYHELFIQYLKSTSNEMESAQKARRIIRKQCSIRGMPCWSWI